MVEYIAYRPLHRQVIGGEVNIKRGDILQNHDGIMFFNDTMVCIWNCQVSKEHFAVNTDKCGLLRGDLIYEIAFAKPLTNLQKDILLSSASLRRFLRNDTRVILFNDDFYTAPILELKSIAYRLGIKE